MILTFVALAFSAVAVVLSFQTQRYRIRAEAAAERAEAAAVHSKAAADRAQQALNALKGLGT